MDSYRPFRPQEKWTPAEKKAARQAFEKALERNCAAIAKKARQMLDSSADSSVIWRVHDYLSEERSRVDRTYDYRYSQLLQVFSVLMRDGWLSEADLEGLVTEKIAQIKVWAAL